MLDLRAFVYIAAATRRLRPRTVVVTSKDRDTPSRRNETRTNGRDTLAVSGSGDDERDT